MSELPSDIVRLIKEFIPRDRDMKSKTADLIKEYINECNKAFCFDFDYIYGEEYRLIIFTQVRIVRRLIAREESTSSFSDYEHELEDASESESESMFADDEILLRLGRRTFYSSY